MKPIIQVENVGKRYMIGHNRIHSDQRFNEWLTEIGKSVMERIAHPLMPYSTSQNLEEFWALKNVNFEVVRGDRIGIIGHNGSGKSTLLKILSRITAPSRGKISIKGRIASLLEVGTGFHPELTGRENIFLNGAILGITRSEIKARFDEIVEFAGVERFLDTPVKRYSSGMYVRLAFAIAAHLEPEILVIDEVLAVGDAEFQKKCLGKMQDITSSGDRTILFVSHNMNAVQNICNKGIVLNHGQIIYMGETSGAVDKYIDSRRKFMQKSISERKDRSGNGFIRFSDCILRNEQGERIVNAYLGKPLTIELTFDCKERYRGDMIFEVIFTNAENIRIASVNLRNLGIFADFKEGKNTVQFHIPRLSIYPGVFNLTLFSAKNDTLCDELRDAVEVQILPGAYNHPQRINDSNLSLTTFDYSASINGEKKEGDY